MGESRYAGTAASTGQCIRSDEVINHLAPVPTRCTSFPLVVHIARAMPLKRSEGGKKKRVKPVIPPSSGNQSTIFQSLAESTSFSFLCHAISLWDSLVVVLLYRGTADRATGRRKNTILVTPRRIISSSASPSTWRTGARRIMQSRLACRLPSVLAPRNAFTRSPPSIISRIGYRCHAPLERSAESRLVSCWKDGDHHACIIFVHITIILACNR